MINSIHNFILTLPNKYNTKVGELGGVLSSGEKQRIGVARAFLHYPKLLILDEPTSSLDPIAEFEFNQLITSKTISATTIIISHRLSAIKNVDRIFVLKDGVIVESGTHDELYNNRSLYYEMFKKQSSMYS